MTGEYAFSGLEVKLAQDTPVGEFSGYAAVFGNVDAHGDVIVPGAFAESLSEKKAAGRSVPMHLMHKMLGGDGLPVGVWRAVEEDGNGLRVQGKISGINTDGGRLLYERVIDGALGGISIGYRIKPNGFTSGKKAGEPKRTLTNLDLVEISLVDDPSNARARVMEWKAAHEHTLTEGLKSVLGLVERDRAAHALSECLQYYHSTMMGGDAPTADERKALLTHLQDAYEAITGQRMPSGMKATPETIREFESALRGVFGLSHSQARAVAEHGFNALKPRDEGEAKAKAASEEALKELKASLTGFSLPKF